VESRQKLHVKTRTLNVDRERLQMRQRRVVLERPPPPPTHTPITDLLFLVTHTHTEFRRLPLRSLKYLHKVVYFLVAKRVEVFVQDWLGWGRFGSHSRVASCGTERSGRCAKGLLWRRCGEKDKKKMSRKHEAKLMNNNAASARR